MKSSRTQSTSDECFCLLGAETLLRQIKELEKQNEGVRENSDIEFIHKLRVASRRLRAALNVFDECFQPKLTKKWRKKTRNLTRSVGAARDADVQIAFLENYSRTIEDNAARALDYIMTSKKARRMAMQPSVIETLDDLEASRVLDEITDSCRMITRKTDENNVKTLSTYEKAHNQISVRLGEMLGYEQFVHDEAAATQHHELRIAAKRLRYTLEILSPIYTGGLSDQISLLKRLQDVLGEMHDYDVWVEELRAELPDIPSDARYGVGKILTHLTETRKSRYVDFVSLWDDAVANGFFDGIRHVTSVDPQSEILHEILLRDKKIGVISDIHANLDALKAVVSDARSLGLEVFLNAGDALGFGIHPSQVVETLRSPMFLNIVGNVDLEILEELQNPKLTTKDAAKRLAIKELSPSDVAYLQSLPKELRLEVGSRNILVAHGTPESVEEHIYPDSPEERLREIAVKANSDVIITGHSHMPMKRQVDGVLFMNPGSVGRPVDGNPKAEYAVLSFDPLSVEFRRVDYEIEAVAKEMRKKGLPENQVQALIRGVSLGMIKKQEEDLNKKELWKSRSTVRKVRGVAKSFLQDESHAEQDRKLALIIFRKTEHLHRLGNQERYWLECAALLHDIGLSNGTKGHHKSSLSLVLNTPELPFTQEERYIIGSIARYHRKALPDKKHLNLLSLSQIQRKKIAVLSSILRIADALDFSHKSVVKGVNIKSFPNHTVLECRFSGSHEMEDASITKKKDLFEREFKGDLSVVWRPQPVTRSAPRRQGIQDGTTTITSPL